MLSFNLTCNSTLEDLRISPGSEIKIVGPLAFHDLALIIGGSCTIIAISLSLYLAFMHAINYTKPREQRHIIRILFMVPVYALSSFLQIKWYWHAVYFQVMSDCYEAFAIASFFALLCHYCAPDLHEQKEYFRNLYPIKQWVWPVNWMAKCCCGQRGPWRTPKSGLTWFNIIWIGIYHYCFIRVAMTLTAVATQHYDRYCESSNSPVFAHIWVVAINCLAVTVAMYCIIQFYVQLREPLKPHKPFLKVLAIKLVVFFSFWQATAISVATSAELTIVQPNQVLAYPDIKVGIPALLLCFEMAVFAILHLWAFPYKPYQPGAPPTFYPHPDERKQSLFPLQENEHAAPSGGPLGVLAFLDAINMWDFVKAFGRGMRWLFCGVKNRKEDRSYRTENDKIGMEDFGPAVSRQQGAEHLPIAHEFRRSRFGLPPVPGDPMVTEERAGLIANAQPHPRNSTHNGSSMTTGGETGGEHSRFASPERVVIYNNSRSPNLAPTPTTSIGVGPPSPMPHHSQAMSPFNSQVMNPYEDGMRMPHHGERGSPRSSADDEWAPSDVRRVQDDRVRGVNHGWGK